VNPLDTESDKGKIAVVFSPKGGVGRTTIVSNLAVALREMSQKKVALVDLNLQFGDVGVLLNVQSHKTIADLIPHIGSLDPDLLEEVMMPTSSGVKILLAPPRPEMAELVTTEAVATILNKLRDTYDYVLVDTWPSFQDQMLSVLDLADRIFVILTLEIPAIKNVRIFLEVADALGYGKDKLTLVLNRADSTGGIKVSDVETSLRHPIPVSIVSDGRLVTQALNAGVPFVSVDKNSMVSKGIYSLARMLHDTDGNKADVAQPSLQRIDLRRVAVSLPFRRG
jgi:pilus assembly protein CpaE